MDEDLAQACFGERTVVDGEDRPMDDVWSELVCVFIESLLDELFVVVHCQQLSLVADFRGLETSAG